MKFNPVIRNASLPRHRVYHAPTQQVSLDQLMERLFPVKSAMDTPSRSNQVYDSKPLVNVLEFDDHFLLELAIPGFNKEEIKIAIEENVLTVEGKKDSDEKELEDARYTYRGFTSANFKRSFKLAKTIDPEQIEAKHEAGILALRLAKISEAVKKPARQIEID